MAIALNKVYTEFSKEKYFKELNERSASGSKDFKEVALPYAQLIADKKSTTEILREMQKLDMDLCNKIPKFPCPILMFPIKLVFIKEGKDRIIASYNFVNGVLTYTKVNLDKLRLGDKVDDNIINYIYFFLARLVSYKEFGTEIEQIEKLHKEYDNIQIISITNPQNKNINDIPMIIVDDKDDDVEKTIVDLKKKLPNIRLQFVGVKKDHNGVILETCSVLTELYKNKNYKGLIESLKKVTILNNLKEPCTLQNGELQIMYNNDTSNLSGLKGNLEKNIKSLFDNIIKLLGPK